MGQPPAEGVVSGRPRFGGVEAGRGGITLDVALWILRGVFLVVIAGLGVSVINSPALNDLPAPYPWVIFVSILAGAVAIIGIDVVLPRKRIEMITCVYFGIVVGLFLTYLLGQALSPLLLDENLNPGKYWMAIQLLVGVSLCYVCISLLIQTKDDFRFIIPYVEFTKEVKGGRPYVLDTSVIIDGRLADVVETRIFDNELIMPRFVLTELQAIADSGDRLRRSRGRRGLDILNRLRANENVDFKIHDRELPEFDGQPVDMKLVLLAKHLEGKVVTGDYNLNKVARLHNVPVINLNDLANALKPVFLPGENLEVRIVKSGEEPGQGVGYLDDGTMIVVESGRDHIGRTVRVAVTSVLQTSAGRMIFGKCERAVEDRAEIRR
ncbi:MAG: PIN domain-containing protein [Planctomycetes bacterium]|nr:PIN domain-containing protein [Planctomycetota bacterium]